MHNIDKREPTALTHSFQNCETQKNPFHGPRRAVGKHVKPHGTHKVSGFSRGSYRVGIKRQYSADIAQLALWIMKRIASWLLEELTDDVSNSIMDLHAENCAWEQL
jgi:hypothetical protein